MFASRCGKIKISYSLLEIYFCDLKKPRVIFGVSKRILWFTGTEPLNIHKTGTNGLTVCSCYNTPFPFRRLKPLRFLDVHKSNFTARFLNKLSQFRHQLYLIHSHSSAALYESEILARRRSLQTDCVCDGENRMPYMIRAC
jgi:hypothetical protein